MSSDLIGRDAEWKGRAACRQAPTDLFITPDDVEDEPLYPDPRAMAYCQRCPVSPECLNEALDNNLPGTWGGTAWWQRQALKRRRVRASCPVCGSRELTRPADMPDAQFCVSCGSSWSLRHPSGRRSNGLAGPSGPRPSTPPTTGGRDL